MPRSGLRLMILFVESVIRKRHLRGAHWKIDPAIVHHCDRTSISAPRSLRGRAEPKVTHHSFYTSLFHRLCSSRWLMELVARGHARYKSSLVAKSLSSLLSCPNAGDSGGDGTASTGGGFRRKGFRITGISKEREEHKEDRSSRR